MTCPFCGNELAPGAGFCAACGNAVSVEAAPQAAPQAVPQAVPPHSSLAMAPVHPRHILQKDIMLQKRAKLKRVFYS